MSINHLIGVQARRPAANGITINTPVSPQPLGAPLVVNGGYTGAMTSGTLVWRQGGSNVGSPVSISTIAGGSWSTTITTPATPGTYTLRAAFNGATPTADSGSVTIETGVGQTLASFTFVGSGDSADTVAVFGHSFPEGALLPTDEVAVRRGDNNEVLRTQFQPLATWESDGSVRTAAFCCELPALTIGQQLQVQFRKGQAHSSPGPNLTWASALSGRSIVVRTWQPGNTTTPLWTYDVAAALPASTDNWMVGPLAISRRVITNVPASAVRTTADGAGTNASMRLVVDVTATKDGMLLVDLAWRNDAVLAATLGTARFGYTIEIDGQIVYDQRPSTGAARDLLPYNWWVRRRAKKGTRVYDFHTTYRPLFIPDRSVLVNSRFIVDYDTTLQLTGEGGGAVVANQLGTQLDNDASRLNDPYWPWGITRAAGATGGRSEIGYRTYEQFIRLCYGTLDPRGQLREHLQGEAFACAGWLFSDAEFERPVLADEWPRFSLIGWSTSTPGTSRTLANGPAFYPSNTVTDHLTSDAAHRGAFYQTPALVDGRRMFYDLAAWRSAECCYGFRNNNGTTNGFFGPDWRAMTPSWETGIAWTPAIYMEQQRGMAWNIRDVADAAYLMPDNYPRRDFYIKNIRAHINLYIDRSSYVLSFIGEEKSLPLMHTGGGGQLDVPYMGNFAVFAFTNAYRHGLAGANGTEVYRRLVEWRTRPVNGFNNLARRILDGGGVMHGTGNGTTWYPTWAEVDAASNNPVIPYPGWNANANTGVGSDYNTNAIATYALMAVYAPTPEGRAAARDALVLLRSFRPQANTHPRVRAIDHGGLARQSNAISPTGFTWRYHQAPTLTGAEVLPVSVDAAPGTLCALVNWTGTHPRMSDNPVVTNHDSFEIVSQPAGNPFTVSRGGAIRRSATGSLALGPNTLQVRCRNFTDAGLEQWSNTITVTITGTATAPTLSGNQNVQIADNAAINTVVATFTYTGTTGTPSIVSGNTGNLFTVTQDTPTVPGGPNTIRVRVAASLSGQTATDPTLTIRVTNPAGTSERTCAIDIVPSVAPPDIAPGQTFSIADSAGVGASPTPSTVQMTGGAPTSVSLSGTNAAMWNIATSGALTTAQALGVTSPNSFNLNVTASNLGGSDTEAIVINVTRPTHAWSGVASSGLLLGAWSVARVLVQGYSGPLIRVRRASDGVEQDFAASGTSIGSTLNTSAITTFIGSSQGFITRIYDQLYGGHLAQTDNNRQYQITATGGAIRTMPGTSPARACGFTPNDGCFYSNTNIEIARPRDRYAIGAVAAQGTTQFAHTFIAVRNASGDNDGMFLRSMDSPFPMRLETVRATNTNFGGGENGALPSETPVAMAFHFDASIGSNLATHLIRNGTTTTGTGWNPSRLGTRNSPSVNMGVVIGSNELTGPWISRPHRFCEGYLFADITLTHAQAVVAEQRAFYGF